MNDVPYLRNPLTPEEEVEFQERKAFQLERLKWAIATAPNSPHLWQHKYKGTPLQILIEHARKST